MIPTRFERDIFDEDVDVVGTKKVRPISDRELQERRSRLVGADLREFRAIQHASWRSR